MQELDAEIKAMPSICSSLSHRCEEIERILLDIGDKCRHFEDNVEGLEKDDRAKVRELIANRRKERIAGQHLRARETSKQIQRETRAIVRARKQAKIGKILEEF